MKKDNLIGFIFIKEYWILIMARVRILKIEVCWQDKEENEGYGKYIL